MKPETVCTKTTVISPGLILVVVYIISQVKSTFKAISQRSDLSGKQKGSRCNSQFTDPLMKILSMGLAHSDLGKHETISKASHALISKKSGGF